MDQIVSQGTVNRKTAVSSQREAFVEEIKQQIRDTSLVKRILEAVNKGMERTCWLGKATEK